MSTTIGFSSEIYHIEPHDILVLPDAPVDFESSVKCSDEVVVLLSNDHSDSLVRGRNVAKQALSRRVSYIPVRFVFCPSISSWNILPILFKTLRQCYKYTGSNIYHTSLTNLRALHIERGQRNADNAYVISKHWHISPEMRVQMYNRLVASLTAKGFDDKYPISIMLCRRCGIKDSVDDGHHRIGICAEYGIERIAVNFRAAGTLPRVLQNLLKRFF